MKDDTRVSEFVAAATVGADLNPWLVLLAVGAAAAWFAVIRHYTRR